MERNADVEGRPCAGCGLISGAGGRREGDEGGGEGAADIPVPGMIDFPKWASELRSKLARDSKGAEADVEAAVAGPSNGVEPRATEPLLATPDESNTEIGGPSTSPHGYGTLDQSVGSADSVLESVVRQKHKGKKRLVDVE